MLPTFQVGTPPAWRLVNLIDVGQVIRLTALTPHQVREWTSRRGLVIPDQLPNGPGSRARFSWQSVLLLRVLNEMHTCFGIGLEDSRESISSLGTLLQGMSFIALWDRNILIRKSKTVAIADSIALDEACLVIPLNPHLELLSSLFGDPQSIKQLSLFSLLTVSSR